MIRATVFDIGGVMIRLAPGWEQATAAAGVTYRPFEITPDFTAQLNLLEADYGAGRITPESYFNRLSTLVNGLYSLPELRRLHLAVIQEEFPDIPMIIKTLKTAGVFTACLSNTCASHWVELDNPARYPGIGLLDTRVASHLVGAMKPDTAIYRHFENATGFAPADILFFDDNLPNVLAARERGWHAEQITDATPATTQIREIMARYGLP